MAKSQPTPYQAALLQRLGQWVNSGGPASNLRQMAVARVPGANTATQQIASALFTPRVLGMSPADLAMMLVPGGKFSHPPKEFPAWNPDYTVVRASPGETVLDYTGAKVPADKRTLDPDPHGRVRQKDRNFYATPVEYNLMRKGEADPMGTIRMLMGRNDAFISDLYVHPDLRNTPALYDLLSAVHATNGLPVHTMFANTRLGRIVHKVAARQGIDLQSNLTHPAGGG